jgi:hypothetical protein
MKTEHLHDIWASPDNTRLTSKQFSFRFPVHIAAKIATLCEMYPTKNRTQIVADLLTAALDDLEKNLPEEMGGELTGEERNIEQMIARREGYEYEPSYSIAGARARFRNTANRHYLELEKELGNEKPEPLYTEIYRTKSAFKK